MPKAVPWFCIARLTELAPPVGGVVGDSWRGELREPDMAHDLNKSAETCNRS